MRGIRSFQPDADVNKFIIDLNKAYAIHLRPERYKHAKIVSISGIPACDGIGQG